MQAISSIVPEANSETSVNNDVCLTDTIATNNQSSNVAQMAPTGVSSGDNQAQTPTQQQHLRPPSSPAQQQQQLHHHHHHHQHQQNHMANHNPNSNLTPNHHHHMAPNIHQYVPQSAHGGSGGGGDYHQRQAPTYHNQQHQQHHQQQYHHQHRSNKYNNQHRGDSESEINHVLLITVINPHYTITCDLIHQICSTYGKVNRIVIFKKNGVQALVEFDNVESAKRAKTMLYGCDIYSGCCTLRIEYAKPTRLNVHKNDNDSFDYTISNLDGGATQEANLIGWPPNDQAPSQSNHTGGVSGTVGLPNHQTSHQSHTNNFRGGLGGRNGSRGGGHNGGPHHYHPSHHHSHHNPPSAPHHHIQPSVPLTQVATQVQHGAPGYSMVTSIDQHGTETTDAFHQDAGFNLARGGTVGGQQPSAYVDSFLTPHGSTGHAGVHSNVYPRQESHGLQQHHARSNQSSNPIHSASFSPATTSNALMSGQSNLVQPQGCVLMVYGLHPELVNCDRLFNLFCLYGNVVRVKFLRTKEGCAMVQMGDIVAADRSISSLNKISLFDNEIQISYSKQPFLHDVIQPFILPDGSPSFKDFTANKNNRFKNPEVASKNRILPPSQVLHFFNAPLEITEEELMHLFKQSTDHEPVSVKIFTPKAENVKSFSGLVTFKDITEATETLVICNHLNMPKQGAPHPYILRLCFSPPTYMRPAQSYPPAASN